jgi:competence protein ComGC
MNEMGNTMIALLLVLFLVSLMFLIFIAMLASFGKGGIF